jgi:uncharacterized protein YrzB (UPF0473 family)
MTEREERDYITIEDTEGNEKQFAIEALFDVEDQSYALLASEDETVLMRVEDDEEEGQYLVGITDSSEMETILSAYQIAVDAAPAE